MNGPNTPPVREAPTTELALVFPILPGMAEQVERLAGELSGPKAMEFRRSQQDLGIRKENWFLNRSPRGDSLTVYVEGEDMVQALSKLIASRSSTDLWLKAEVKRVTGIDFGGSAPLSLPKQILRYPR
jgi:hypothetical protein